MSRILVIDDDRSVRHLIAKAFEDSDVEVVPAASAEEGMRLLDESQSDVVLLDILLPESSGLDLFEKIRTCRSEVAGDFHHLAFEQRHGDQGDDLGRVRLPAQAARLGAHSRSGSPGDGNPPAHEHSRRNARSEKRATKRCCLGKSERHARGQQSPNAGGVQGDRPRRPAGCHGVDPRRKRHRQGAGRPRPVSA